MQIQFEQEQDTCICHLSGRLDTTTAPNLDKVLSQQLIEKNMTFDLKNLEYISSAGLRIILATLKRVQKQGGQLSIINPNEDVLEVFEITGFKKLLKL